MINDKSNKQSEGQVFSLTSEPIMRHDYVGLYLYNAVFPGETQWIFKGHLHCNVYDIIGKSIVMLWMFVHANFWSFCRYLLFTDTVSGVGGGYGSEGSDEEQTDMQCDVTSCF